MRVLFSLALLVLVGCADTDERGEPLPRLAITPLASAGRGLESRLVLWRVDGTGECVLSYNSGYAGGLTTVRCP